MSEPSPPAARRRSSTHALVVVAALASMVWIASATEPVAAALPPSDAPPVSLIGDSTMAGMQWTATAANDARSIVGNAYRLTFDAESCRRLVAASCRGRFDTVPLSVLPLMRTSLSGRLGEAMVVMAGYDDATITPAVEQVMAEAEAQSVTKVMWLTYRTNTTYVLPGGQSAAGLYTGHNAALAAAAQHHTDLQILDWSGFSADKPTWFASDGIHLTLDGAVGLANFVKAALDAQPAIGRCRTTSALTGAPDAGVVTAAAPATPATGFEPLVPIRVLDTRDPALGGSAGKLGIGRTVSIDVSGIVPDDAVAVAFSVTATGSCLPGFFTVFACGARPPTSNLNYESGRTTAGVAITALNAGKACIFSSATTDVVVDVMGAFTPGGDRFHPMAPTRWIDTRGGAAQQLPQITGIRNTPTQTQLMMRGVGGVPPDATAVWMNLTIADPSASTVLTAYPGPCTTPPLASNVNARALHSTASSVLVGVGADGSVCVMTYSGVSHIVVDVAGWFGPGSDGLAYRPGAGTRLLDTRLNSGAPTTADTPVHVDGVAVLNVVAVESAGPGFVAVRPCGSPLVSSLINTSPGEDTANLTAVSGDGNGNVCVRASSKSHLVVDQVATFAP